MIAHTFRYADGVAPNVLALGWILIGYPLGVVLLTQAAWGWNLLGMILTTLTLIWSAYFIHEFAHQTIFKTARANARWGTLMSWINGSCFASFEAIRKKHMRHHTERADVVSFDVKRFLLDAPAWLRGAVLALEWLHFPAVEFVMRAFVVMLPFRSGANSRVRLRILAVASVRIVAWAVMAWVSLKAVFLYFACYVLFINTLRFADCFQHTYEAYVASDDTPMPDNKVRDRTYEQTNTYSDVVGIHSTWLNLIWLNFGFHNAHHERPTMPWYRLPSHHRELFPSEYAQVITVGELLRSFHVHRVARILSTDYGHVQAPGSPGRADQFFGAVGVSFLTAV